MSLKDFSLYSSAVLVTSDRCFSGIATDESGALIVAKMTEAGFKSVDKVITQDDRQTIVDWLIKLSDKPKMAIIITVGGTGLCPNDVTPEATQDVIQRTCSGITTALSIYSLKITPFAALSRMTAGIRNNTLIVNFPGNQKACEECWTCLEPVLHHSIHQINYDRDSIDAFHSVQIKSQIMNVPNCTEDCARHSHIKGIVDNLSKLALIETTLPSGTVNINKNTILTNNNNYDKSVKEKKSDDLKGLMNTELNLNDTIPTIDRCMKSCVPLIKSVRTRESKYPLIEYYQAISKLYEESTSLYSNHVTLIVEGYDSAKNLIGETLAESVKTKRIIPPYRVSTMDGFLINIPPDVPEEFSFVFIEALLLPDLESFSAKQKIEKSNTFFCYPVNTGGRIPEKDCAVVPIEKTGPVTDNKVTINELKRGMYTREIGSDLPSDFVLSTGTLIGPVELSLLCSMGVDRVKIVKKPTISVMSTGDELVQPFGWSSIHDDTVIDTNGPLLTTFFMNKGFSVCNCGIVKDDCDRLFTKMVQALSKTDILIISGGASMGTKDYVKEIIEKDLNGAIHFGRVNIKPGKPVGFATCLYKGEKKFIFCLPGNPVSAFITSLVLIMPFLRQSIKLNPITANLHEPAFLNDWKKIFELVTTELDSIEEGEDYYFEDRMEFIRAVIVCFNSKTSKYLVSASIKQQSSRLSSLRGCDCLLIIPSGMNGTKLEVGKDYPGLLL